MVRVVLAVAVAVAWAACGGAQAPRATDGVAALRDSWLQAVNAKQLDAIADTYSLDAVVMPITGSRIVSAAAIRNLYERIWQRATVHVELASHVVERSGDLAYDSGDYVERVVADRTAVNIAGSYVFVYRREPRGWRIVEQIWTESTGAPDSGRRTP